jgi:hypothetical protein
LLVDGKVGEVSLRRVCVLVVVLVAEGRRRMKIMGIKQAHGRDWGRKSKKLGARDFWI